MDDLAKMVANRPGWAMVGKIAVFATSPRGWLARVTYTTVPGRTYQRLHVAVIDPDKYARYTTFATTAGEAIRVAETQVRGRTT